MHSLAIFYFFAVAAIGGLMVRKAYVLQSTYGLPYLHSYTFFLASWSAFVLFSIFQFILAINFLPGGTWFPLTQATSPLFTIIMAVSLYFISAFLAQLSGRPLTKSYKIAYVVIWAAMAAGVVLVNGQLWDSSEAGTKSCPCSTFCLRSLRYTAGFSLPFSG